MDSNIEDNHLCLTNIIATGLNTTSHFLQMCCCLSLMGSSADTSRVDGSHPYKTLPWQKQLAVRKELYSTQSKHNLFGQRILLFKDKADLSV